VYAVGYRRVEPLAITLAAVLACGPGGWEYHADRVAFASDRERDAFMLDHGLVTVRITWERLHEAAQREAARLHRILDRRARELAVLRAAL
jgi:hypothetical protein